MNAWPSWEQITGKTWEDSTNLDPRGQLLITEEHREQMAEEARENLALHMDRQLNLYNATVTYSDGKVIGPADIDGETLREEIREHASRWDYSPVLNDYRALSDYNKMIDGFRRSARL